jgi:hypothetical protein
MATRNGLTARDIFLLVVGCVITILLLGTGTRFYVRAYRDAILCFALAGALSFVFFRTRLIALALIIFSLISATAGPILPFHPSVLGFVFVVGSAAALYFIARWSYNRYPYLSYKHSHVLLEGDAAMAAENARLEAEARELARRRPYGPWLFR